MSRNMQAQTDQKNATPAPRNTKTFTANSMSEISMHRNAGGSCHKYKTVTLKFAYFTQKKHPEIFPNFAMFQNT
uniref:Uncharacterized protein n=1 Tax=Arion vulgaris TaxID=1028688 RepID=A0A0B7BD48_9EUPU